MTPLVDPGADCEDELPDPTDIPSVTNQMMERRQAFPSSSLQQEIPMHRVRRASHYMSAMGLWRPPVETVSLTPMSSVACNACTLCQDCCPRVPR